MKIEDELTLSFYKEISKLDEKRDIWLVQHVETKEIFVRKILKVYDREVYTYMKEKRFPYTPEIIEMIEDGENLILIEEYVQGKSLDVILREGVFSPEDAKATILKICEILKPLHNHVPAIVHRDIKPGNIIVKDSQIYLIDFDASRDYEPDKNKDTVLMGTREYAAPEQFGFSQSTPRTDIYALGVLMNVMITGKFPADELAKGKARKIIKKCTAVDPKDRYACVEDLENAIKGNPSSYAPPGFRARNPLFMILGAFGYIAIFSISLTLDITKSDGTPAGTIETIVSRFAILIIFLGLTLYWGNYRFFLEKFPFKKMKMLPLEILRIAMGTALIAFLPILILALLFP